MANEPTETNDRVALADLSSVAAIASTILAARASARGLWMLAEKSVMHDADGKLTAIHARANHPLYSLFTNAKIGDVSIDARRIAHVR